MGPGDDSRDREVIATLQRTADVPLGMTARLEAAVLRRARAPSGFTAAEKWCLASAATLPFLAGGAGNVLLLLVGLGGVVGYLQWTLLVEESDSP